MSQACPGGLEAAAPVAHGADGEPSGLAPMPVAAPASLETRSHPQRWWILSAVAVGTLMAPLDGSIVSIALPAITADLRAEDVLDLINELRNAGAEAIALNGERIVLSTPVVATSGGVMVNGVALRPPYLFQAIGNPETLDRALTRRGGLISFLRNTYPQAVITVEQRPLLLLPATHLTYQWRYARPAN